MMLNKQTARTCDSEVASRPQSRQSVESDYATPTGEEVSTKPPFDSRPSRSASVRYELQNQTSIVDVSSRRPSFDGSRRGSGIKRQQDCDDNAAGYDKQEDRASKRQAQGDFWPPINVDHWSPPRSRGRSMSRPSKSPVFAPHESLNGEHWPSLTTPDQVVTDELQNRWLQRIAGIGQPQALEGIKSAPVSPRESPKEQKSFINSRGGGETSVDRLLESEAKLRKAFARPENQRVERQSEDYGRLSPPRGLGVARTRQDRERSHLMARFHRPPPREPVSDHKYDLTGRASMRDFESHPMLDYGHSSPPPPQRLKRGDPSIKDSDAASEDHFDALSRCPDSRGFKDSTRSKRMNTPRVLTEGESRAALRQEAHRAALGADGAVWSDIGLVSVDGHQFKEEEM